MIVRQLLSTLEQSSLREEARSLRQQFDLRGWTGLGAPDIALVAALVGRLQTLPPARVAAPEPPPPSEPVPQAVLERPEEPGWSPLENSAAWVDAIPRGRELLGLLDALARCDDGDEAAVLLERVFVGHLRYEAHAVDETQRLDSTMVLRRLRTVARHGDFVVSLAELVFPYPHGSTFQPIFRRHPYGLVVAIAPGWNACQFAYRVEKDGGSFLPRTRQMVGHARSGELRDTLLIWLRRMSLLRLTGGEEVAALVRRVEEALEPGPVEVSRHWNTVALSPSLSFPPGVPWDRLLAHERRAFLQEDLAPGQPRMWWGLERVLRMALPFTLSERRGKVCYRGYDLGAPTSSEMARRSGGSWYRPLTLRLELVCEDGTCLPIQLPAAVPEVDDRGRVLLDGTWYRWVPRVLARGLLTSGDARTQEEPFDDGFEEDIEEELPMPELEEGPGQGSAEPEVESPQELLKDEGLAPSRRQNFRDPVAIGTLAGASLCALLELAAYRKLLGISARLGVYAEDARDLPRNLLGILRGLAGRDERLLLASKYFLKAVLEPVPDTTAPDGLLPILRHAVSAEAGSAPAWACPDVSSELRPGAWVPVAAARLTPGGELAVPLRDASGVIRLSVAMVPLPQVNPRAGGAGSMAGPGWISCGLSSFASLPAGRLQAAARVAAHARPLPSGLRVVHVRGSHLGARWMEASLPPREGELGPSREVSVRIPVLLCAEGVVPHRVLLSRGAPVKAGDAWLEAQHSLWARIPKGPLKNKSLHEVSVWNLAANIFTPPPKKDTEEGEEEDILLPLTLKLPGAAERWFIPPGIQGRVLDLREEMERDRSGMGLAWRITLVVGNDPPTFPWSHLVLSDGRVLPFQAGLKREDAPYGEDGLPAQLVIEDPTLASTPPEEVWFDGGTGELIERATSRVGACYVLPETSSPLVGPDLQLRFRARDGEGIPASAEAPALSSMERLWWTAAHPESAAELARIERAWSGGTPPFLPRLAEVLEAAGIAPPEWKKPEAARHTEGGRPIRFETLTMSRVRYWATGYDKEEDAPVRWSCWCGRAQGRRRAFEMCDPKSWGCGTPVVLRPALQGRRALPVLGLSEPLLHPWRMETAACLLGLTLHELKTRQIRSGGVVLGIQMRQALRNGPPGAAALKRLGGPLSAAEREPLLRGLKALEHDAGKLGAGLVGRLFLSTISVLPNALHPTGMPPGGPGPVKSPLTEAYQRVRFASNRLAVLRTVDSKLLRETARASFHASVESLFGPLDQGMHQGEPTSLAGLITRLWPLTRAPGLRSVVPGLFRMEGRPAGSTADGASVEREVERIPPVYEVLARASPFVERHKDAAAESVANDDSDSEASSSSPRDGIERMRLRTTRTVPGVTTTGIFSAEAAVFLPSYPSLTTEPASAEFWEERAARDRLIRGHLPRLMVIVGAFTTSDAAEVEAEGGIPESRRMPPGSVGTVTLRELMAALVRQESRPLEFCRLLEARRPTPFVEDGARACALLEETVRRAFPGEGPWLHTGRRLLVRALVGWWKSLPRVGAPAGWTWLPPNQKGPAGGRRFVPPLASVAWVEWPGMAAATAPVRFFEEHAGRPVEGHWNQTLLRALGLEVEAVPTSPDVSAAQPGPEPLGTVPEPLPSPGPPRPEWVLVTPLPLEPAVAPTSGEDEISILEVPMAAWLSANSHLPAEPEPEVSLLASSMSAWLERGNPS
ncbi:hypothetical protein D7X12_04780 [Corallococcus sicarius]|uniref:Uncharacterized protein n=1 Tax=Corallococcus sicarius TaxID=2316726 RepID=A0A3A8NZY7_9BACT|nr:hypothetical protein D7X12_04780 [Corallococcus sicarius]